jgi:hypothetical protein
MHISTADRRSAHRRVGAAAITAFLVLLILALLHQPADAEPTVPAATPAATPSQQQQPSQPQQTEPGPSGSVPGFGRDRGFDPRGDDEGGSGGPGFGGGGFRGGDDGGAGGGFGGGSDGGGSAPAPSTGGNQT